MSSDSASLQCSKCGIVWHRPQNYGATEEDIVRYHNQMDGCNAKLSDIKIKVIKE